MAIDFKVMQKVKGNPSAEVELQRRLKITPGQDYAYDMPKELIAYVLKEFPLEALFEREDQGVGFLRMKGQEFMNILIPAADSDEYRDRTAEMIEKVAQQTGIKFPHVFERYVELGILTLRPRDVWTVTEATTRCFKIRSFNCSLEQRFGEKGMACQEFCLASSGAAADKVGLKVEMDCRQAEGSHRICELIFRVKTQ